MVELSYHQRSTIHLTDESVNSTFGARELLYQRNDNVAVDIWQLSVCRRKPRLLCSIFVKDARNSSSNQAPPTRIRRRIRVDRALKPLWRSVTKRCGFGERIHWFGVDRKPIRVKKMCCFKNFRIRVGEQFSRTQKIIHYPIVAYFVDGNFTRRKRQSSRKSFEWE